MKSLRKHAGFGSVQTDRLLEDVAVVNLGDIFGCFGTDLVNVRQQSHLMDSWEDDIERFEKLEDQHHFKLDIPDPVRGSSDTARGPSQSRRP